MMIFQEDMMTIFQEGGKQAAVGDKVAETLHWDLSVETHAGCFLQNKMDKSFLWY